MPTSRVAEMTRSKVPGYVAPPPKPPREMPPKPKVVYRGTGVFIDGETIHLPENILLTKKITSGTIGMRRKFKLIIIEQNANR